MRACGLLAIGVLISLVDQNEVAATPLPDPCSIIFTPLRPPRITTTTTTTTPPPKIQDKEIESRKEKVRIFETLLEEILLGTRDPKAKEPEKPQPTASPVSLLNMDIDTVIAAYFQFLRRVFRMLQ